MIQEFNFPKINGAMELIYNSIVENKIFDGFFDSVESVKDSSENIVGFRGVYKGKESFSVVSTSPDIAGSHNITSKVTLANGLSNTWTGAAADALNFYIPKITKTDYGIFIRFIWQYRNTAVKEDTDFFCITKTDKDGLAIVIPSLYTSYRPIPDYTKMCALSMDNSSSITFESTALINQVQESGTMSLAPIACVDCDEYLPHVFKTVYSSYKNQQLKFQLNDKQYVSNGYYCLEADAD